ncbi:MAG: class III poly(R)-hydroxyalkanoic acid synthase subunit PhaC [Gammaproteobacteria bacterium]|nr:class III poly(R)-hydroxyalkanoic acid synthase subunit PhaC [Gammaproteobacteria bacterium]
MQTFDTAAVVAELNEFAQDFVRGVQTLGTLDDLESGTAPREVIYTEDKLKLYRYRPATAEGSRVPVLIVYALVNRPTMLDLQPDRSTIRGLLEHGLDVYLIDWGYPDNRDCGLTLNDYINGYLDRCVDAVRTCCGAAAVNILGVCQGGAFSLCYTATHDKVKNLVTMVTPVDFHTPDNMLGHWIRAIDVDQIVDTFGNVPGELLNWVFLMLKPFRLTGQKYVHAVKLLGDPNKARNFVRMEKWILDSPDQAGEAFREFVTAFFQDNGLINDRIQIGQRPVHLRDIRVPVLNVFALHDHLVPSSASRPLARYVGTDDYQELEFSGGHIGIYVSASAQREIAPAIAAWFRARA